MRVMPGLIKDANRWRAVTGPLSATVCTLHDIGWKPAGPAHWRVNPHLMAHVGGAMFAKAHIMPKAQADIVSRLADESSAHDHGKGINGSMLLNGARKAKKQLVAEGDFAAAAAIDYVVTGVYRDPEVKDEMIDGGDARSGWRCAWCGDKPAQPRLHELYACPDNADIDEGDDEERSRNKRICDEALKGWDVDTCLWARGITPSAWIATAGDIDFDDARIKSTDGLRAMLAQTRVGYSDGSGGDGESHTALVRTMCGAATFSREGESVRAEGLVAETPGRQTVPRAEVWGAALLIERAPRAGPFKLVLDAAYVKNGIDRRGDLLKGPNGDLWGVLLDLIDRRDGEVEAVKIRSHIADKGAKAINGSGFQWGDILGNELADAAAESGHALLANGSREAEKTKNAENYTVQVARRLGKVQARIWRATAGAAVFQAPEPPAIDTAKEDKAAAVTDLMNATASNGHRLRRDGDGLRCEKCNADMGMEAERGVDPHTLSAQTHGGAADEGYQEDA